MNTRNGKSYSASNGTTPHTKQPENIPTSKIIVILSVLTLSASLFYLTKNSLYYDGIAMFLFKVSPGRLISAIIVPLYIATSGLKKKSLDSSGAFLGVIVAFVLTITRWSFLWSLMAFFVTF